MNKLPIVRREKDTITVGECSVCATKTLEFHFGAVCCVACGAFFRRSISDGKKFTCKNNEKCKIVPGKRSSSEREYRLIEGSRSSCRSCRLQRCIDAGMDPRAVQSAGSTSKSREIRMEMSPSFTPPSTVSIPQKENIIKTFESHYSAISHARKLIYGNGTVEELIEGAELKPRKIHLFDRVDSSVLRVEQSLVIVMLKKLKMFNEIGADDQLLVLSSFCLNLSIIEKYYFTYKMDGIEKGHLYFSNTWYTDCHDFHISPPDHARQLQSDSYGNLFLKAQMTAIQRLSVPMRIINMNQIDLVGLLLWDLFDPEIKNLSDEGKRILTGYRQIVRRDWIDLYIENAVDEPERRFIQLADLHKVVQRVSIDYREDFHVFRIFKLLDYDGLIDDILGLPSELRVCAYKRFGPRESVL
ncbi:hypothetical protein PFISCL1PPCAC_14813 [Pristionchus fissidentatus]|uniref:Nuclear receptor n=1 Tax=Pristionchus fissidentatus TaxID=1538716 RepID=A0AAV5VVH5_9BILA|nr:hypothetical protein PFISCL1PPCAC_14813 [Pristionchus fissidentatus]